MSESKSPAICLFCGARSGNDPRWTEAASQTGRSIAERGWTLVYGGGDVGLMGTAADAALAAGGQVVGVIPQRLLEREVGHKGLTRLEVVSDMATRKDRMIALSDAFITLPGGLGTMDELFEVMTLRQIGYHGKPCALLNVHGYYQSLLAMIDGFVEAGLVDRRERDRLIVADEVDSALQAIARAMHGPVSA
jgi:hypothetical protein